MCVASDAGRTRAAGSRRSSGCATYVWLSSWHQTVCSQPSPVSEPGSLALPPAHSRHEALWVRALSGVFPAESAPWAGAWPVGADQ